MITVMIIPAMMEAGRAGATAEAAVMEVEAVVVTEHASPVLHLTRYMANVAAE